MKRIVAGVFCLLCVSMLTACAMPGGEGAEVPVMLVALEHGTGATELIKYKSGNYMFTWRGVDGKKAGSVSGEFTPLDGYFGSSEPIAVPSDRTEASLTWTDSVPDIVNAKVWNNGIPVDAEFGQSAELSRDKNGTYVLTLEAGKIYMINAVWLEPDAETGVSGTADYYIVTEGIETEQ